MNGSTRRLALAIPVSAEVSLREFRRRKWFLVECLSRYMTIVGRAKDAEVLWVMGSIQGKWLDVIDLEVAGGIALVT